MKRIVLMSALVLFAAACGGSDSEPAATTDGGDSALAIFAISRVEFGADGFVSVTNVGTESGNLEGWQLCQRPDYYAIGSVDVAAGEMVHFTNGAGAGLAGQIIEANGRFGGLGESDGEIGLYDSSSFSSASAIRSYVEWGSSSHGRSSVAVEAGIWPDGGFVESDGAVGIAATTNVPTSPADWANS